MQEIEDDEVFEAESSSHGLFNPFPRPFAHLHSVDSGYEAMRDYSPYDSAGRSRSRSFAERSREALAARPQQPTSASPVEVEGRALSRRATWPELPVDQSDAEAERHRIRTESMRSVGTQTSSLEGLSLDDDADDDDDDDNVFSPSSTVGSTGPLPDVIQPMNERRHSLDGSALQNLGRNLRDLADSFRARSEEQRASIGRRRTWSLQESFRLSSHIEIRARRWSLLDWTSSEHSSSSANQQ